MLLPFVRELFVDVEKLPAFARVASHLKEGTGRIRVSGLTPTAKALLLVLFQRAAGRPFIFVVNDNRAVEDFLPVLRGFCELTAACDPESVISLPARDVLPFQNLSPHPELQEERATALWKIATGAVSIVVSPVAATAIRLHSSDYYADLGRTLRRGESFDLEALLAHLNTVGYTSTDVVEMPGQYALRGGILDVYSPEVDRPLRIEFFGDEADSIRKFDPASQRSSTPVDEALLLPLTETPVSEHLLGAIHTRLSGKRIVGTEDMVEAAVRAGGVNVFPGWEFYSPVAGADSTIFDLLPNAPRSCSTRPISSSRNSTASGRVEKPMSAAVSAIWSVPKISTCLPKVGGKKPQHFPAPISSISDYPQPGRRRKLRHRISLSALARFHGAVPAMLEEVQKLNARRQTRPVRRAKHRRSRAPRRCFHRVQRLISSGKPHRGGESYADETSYFAGEVLTTTLATAYVPDGVLLPEAHLAIFGARDLFDESESVASRPQRSKSKVSAFLSDFRDLQVGDYVVHVEHGIGQYQGLKEINQGDGSPPSSCCSSIAEAARLYVPLTRLDLVQKYRSSEGAKPGIEPSGHAAWAEDQRRA
jgi:transcription-repair coupling factor (superfamily II helicase)